MSAVGPDSSRAVSSNRNLQHTQAQVEEKEQLYWWSELDDWPEALQPDSPQFQTRADKLMRKYWWKNMEVHELTHHVWTKSSLVKLQFIFMKRRSYIPGSISQGSGEKSGVSEPYPESL
uniref:Uncharacterized protein n=1 Tax=Takifugu rubripes TaxID=31033 RepID=A0A674NS39_TAKRU